MSVSPRPTDDELIARVLRRAHQRAEDVDDPNEARGILYLAHSFADELAATNPRFDRGRFIRHATEQPAAHPSPKADGRP
jgi:hypothetical protein